MMLSYIDQSRVTLRRWMLEPGVQRFARGCAYALAGFCLSAASLEQGMLPLVLGLVWACRGWGAVLTAAGGMVGYGVFWGNDSLQALVWTGLALVGVLLLGDRPICREAPLLIPATGMLMVSAVGLGFQLLGRDPASIPLYLIRVALGGAAPWLFTRYLQKREPVTGWFCCSLLTLGLAQMVPFPWLGLGFVAVGAAAARGAFPCAALTGLALDLSGVTSLPMTAVTVLAWCVRFLPRHTRWLESLAPGCVGLLFLYVCRRWEFMILPGLFLGGIIAGFFPGTGKTLPRRGQTGAAQVRLELTAQVLAQTRRLLEDVPERLVDGDALVQRAVGEACGGCAAREHCRDSGKLRRMSAELLQSPLLTAEELPLRCKKSGRVLAQLRQAQEQLRAIRADRLRQREYREAVIQQYAFLEQFLWETSESLPQRCPGGVAMYTPVVSVWGNRRHDSNGDRCAQFAGPKNRYYIILCDGMGTGPGAVKEGKSALQQLQQMLQCGFPPEHALGSLNSLCALRERPAAVTADLAQVDMETGKVTLYKWGAAASYLVTSKGAEKLGTVSPPPGLSVMRGYESSCTVLLKRGQTLLMVSDGVEEQQVLDACTQKPAPTALGPAILRGSSLEDDATVVAIGLLPAKET